MKKNIRLKLKIFACVGLVMALIVGGTFGYIVFDKKTKADGNIEDVRMSKINEAFLQRRSYIMSKDKYSDKKTNREKQINNRKEEESRVIIQLKGKAAIDKVKNVYDTSEIISCEGRVLEGQKEAIKKIEKITGNRVKNQTGCLMNTIVINATKSEINKINELSEVVKVSETYTYKVNDIESTLKYTIEDYKSKAACILKETGIEQLRKDTDYTGKSTVVAIIDTGVNYEHQDMKLDEGVVPKFTKDEWTNKINSLGYGKYFSEKVPFGYNYIDEYNDIIASKDYHGYHVSGIAGGNGEISSVAPNTQLVALKALGEKGGTTDQIVCAIEDAVKLDVDVINMSLGCKSTNVSEDDVFKMEAIEKATEMGIICCVAAGNESTPDNNGYNKFNMSDTSTVRNLGTISDTLTVASANITVNNDNAKKEMSTFTSWGPSNGLKIKPDISAPGEAILSTWTGTNEYMTLSGTSMATSFISGCVALVKNSIKNENLKSYINRNIEINGKELEYFIKNNILLTAEPIIDTSNGENVPFSIRQQGAGLINVNAAVKNRVIASYDGEPKLQLEEIKNGKEFEIELRNFGDKDVTYTVVGGNVYKPVINETNSYRMQQSNSAKITISGGVTVPAKGEAKVKGSISVLSDYPDNTFIEGYVKFIGQDTPNLSMPLLAFNGDWIEEPIIDKSVYEEGQSFLEKKRVKNINTNKTLTSFTSLVGQCNVYTDCVLGMKGMGKLLKTYDGNLSAFSPNGDGVMDRVYARITQLRNADEIKVSVLDENKNEIRVVGSALGLRRNTLKELSECPYKKWEMTNQNNYNNILSWDGKVYDKGLGEYVNVKDGQYYIKIESTLSSKIGSQEIIMPVKVDTKEPSIITSTLNNESEKCEYKFNVKDDIGLEEYAYIYIDGKVKEYQYDNLKKDEENNYYIELGDIKDKEVYAMFIDMAGNKVIKNIQE